MWVLAGLLIACLGVLAGCVWLVRSLWRRAASAGRTAQGVVLLAAAGLTFGGVGTVVGLIKAVGAVGGESVDPSQKARILAEGISEAMNCVAFSVLLWLPSLALALFLKFRR
jgi:MotA/TolQ/ExbB proton channel family